MPAKKHGGGWRSRRLGETMADKVKLAEKARAAG